MALESTMALFTTVSPQFPFISSPEGSPGGFGLGALPTASASKLALKIKGPQLVRQVKVKTIKMADRTGEVFIVWVLGCKNTAKRLHPM